MPRHALRHRATWVPQGTSRSLRIHQPVVCHAAVSGFSPQSSKSLVLDEIRGLLGNHKLNSTHMTDFVANPVVETFPGLGRSAECGESSVWRPSKRSTVMT
jgi:hypothetical protein